MENELIRKIEEVDVKVRTPRFMKGNIRIYTENSGNVPEIIGEKVPYGLFSKVASYAKKILMPLPHIKVNPRISISQDNRKVYL